MMCPVLSTNNVQSSCKKESCAWYIQEDKECSIHSIGKHAKAKVTLRANTVNVDKENVNEIIS